jgi:hypothetical protein
METLFGSYLTIVCGYGIFRPDALQGQPERTPQCKEFESLRKGAFGFLGTANNGVEL